MPNYQPQFHLGSPRGRDCVPFDPNGAVFWRGRYHLGFLIADYYECAKHHWWGHWSSENLIDWTLHPPMLSPSPEGPDEGIWSGNAFVDRLGRVVVHYYGAYGGNCFAIGEGENALDELVKLTANPVMRDPAWDPFAWYEDGVYYSISGSEPTNPSAKPALYRTEDDGLADWTLVGDFLKHEMPEVEPGEDLSCPDFFELEGERVLLCISHTRGARYYLGRFDGTQFEPEVHERINSTGGVCFAPETLLDDRGRRIFWSWAVGSPSCMTIPLVLTMGDDRTLRMKPVEELESLRHEHASLTDVEVDVDSDADLPKGDCLEVRMKFAARKDVRCGIKLRCSPDGEEETRVLFDGASSALCVDMTKSSMDESQLPKQFVMTMTEGEEDNPHVSHQRAPLDLRAGEEVDLRIYLDRSILEVIANERVYLTQRLRPTRDDSLGVRLFSESGPVTIRSVDVWQMKPISVTRKQD